MAQLAPLLPASASGGAGDTQKQQVAALVPNLDVLCWNVGRGGGGGFSPHRDRQPRDVPGSFQDPARGRAPRYASCWVALNGGARPDVSCLHMIPRSIDPGYLQG